MYRAAVMRRLRPLSSPKVGQAKTLLPRHSYVKLCDKNILSFQKYLYKKLSTPSLVQKPGSTQKKELKNILA